MMLAPARPPRPARRLRFVDGLAACGLAGGVPVIAEIKARTPRHGDLLRGRDPKHIARDYAAAGATCLSVVTGRWFGGSRSLLERVAAASALPILRKDFIRTPAELRRSRELGADAVLLTAGLLRRTRLEELVSEALDLGLAPFVEVTTPDELTAARDSRSPVIAVNNRDIASKECDGEGLGRSARLIRHRRAERGGAERESAERGTDRESPERGTDRTLWVSASGLDTAADVRAALALGFDAVLIGTALLRARDAGAALGALIR